MNSPYSRAIALMSDSAPLLLSQQILSVLQTRSFIHHQDRIPEKNAPLLVVSNHRSVMDVPVLMAALQRPIRFACHRYMTQVPILKDVVTQWGAIPLDEPTQRRHQFFQQANQALQARQSVGIFPEGAPSMIHESTPQALHEFHRGFAHLALKANVPDLAVLPVAIASHQESVTNLFPVRLLSWFDPTEPLFHQAGWHPMVLYHRVTVLVGRPVWITPAQQHDYHGKQARSLANALTEYCHTEIATLLSQGVY
ncbi:lysophospholipid acyltransferase family protein [Leptolyngbya sp. AN02str]|uniref:lysophospholipid acyltransferase family protein n=1 Tax=Leptolyngbya sp. AN02str TaxID=3423363 RepID=UPI003D3176AD